MGIEGTLTPIQMGPADKAVRVYLDSQDFIQSFEYPYQCLNGLKSDDNSV